MDSIYWYGELASALEAGDKKAALSAAQAVAYNLEAELGKR